MPTARRFATAAAGPLLILALVLFALRGFAFGDRLTNEHPDLLAFWLPRWAFLGRSLAAWHVPLWNPFEMVGYRFAADPQSGWLSLPPMALFSTLGPGTAMRAMVVFDPLLAGLGLFAFCRVEGFARATATIAGLSIAGMMSGSELAISMPFAGALAWTTVVLIGAAGFRRAERWSSRIGWLALAALGWSQVASAHLSHGLVTCTLLVVAYLLANAAGQVRAGSARGGVALARLALFLVVLPLASLAVLVPRLSFIGDSSLGSGYDRLGAGLRDVTGVEERPIRPDGLWSGWILAHGAAPGAFAGGVVLLGVPLALRARRRRAVVLAMAGSVAVVWIVLLDPVITTPWVRDGLLRLPFGDVLLHNPARFRTVAIIALPVVGAAGIQGLLDEPMSWRRALVWVSAGAVLWLGIPVVANADLEHWWLLAASSVPIAVGFILVARRPRAGTVALVSVLSVELVVSAVLAGRWSGDDLRLGLETGARAIAAFQPLRAPDVDLGAFVAPTPFVGAIGADRYLTWVPPQTYTEKGYLFAQDPIDWPALTNERGTLFGVRDALGYNPVQLPRYWAYLRATNELSLVYNAAAVQVPTTTDVDLLGVRYLIVPAEIEAPLPGRVAASADGYDLLEVADGALASVSPEVRTVADPEQALRAVTSAGFDPERQAVVESAEPVPSGMGSAAVDEPEPGRIDVSVDADGQALVVIRAAFDDGWEATVDGRPVDIEPTDAFLIGVVTPPGHHVLSLRYRDAQVWLGLLLSVGVWTLLAAAFVAARLRERRIAPERAR